MIRTEPHALNGQPGAILRYRAGNALGTLAPEMLDGQIQTNRGAPDKLGHVGPVGDAWAVDREAKQARRDAG